MISTLSKAFKNLSPSCKIFPARVFKIDFLTTHDQKVAAMAMPTAVVLPVNASRRMCCYHSFAPGDRGMPSIGKSQSIFPSSHFERWSRLCLGFEDKHSRSVIFVVYRQR